METEQLRRAASDVAIAAEITVNLPGKSVGPEQYHPQIGRPELAAKGRVYQERAIVRDDALANHSGKNQHEAIEEAVRIKSSFPLNLWQQMSGPLNGTGNQVREKADEQAVFDERSRSRNPSFINVHDIRDFLKGIKRNSRRKNDTNERQGNVVKTKVVQHADKGPGKEIKILENPKNREVQKQGKDEPLSAMWILLLGNDFLSDQKIHGGAANHEREEPPVPPAVEKVTGQE